MHIKEHWNTVNRHRALVRSYCFRLGLVWQGLTHDLSKYSPVEFWRGARYYQGYRSPNDQERMETGRKKIGAILGDYVEVGCNSVLNPGTVIGPHSNIYPTSSVRGTVPANSIYKDKDNIASKE